jgi:hypothetical protein
VLQRPTQTAAFWRDKFEVTADDVEFLYQFLLDAQKPQKLSELALSLVDEYLRRENARIEQELTKGAVYAPRQRYQVGQTLVFPGLEFAVGAVIGVRPGQNPEHGDFEVIQVQFGENAKSKPREFAAGLQTSHRLNQVNGASLVNDVSLLSASEIYKLYQSEIDEALLYALEEGERHEEFVEVGGSWLLKDMLAEVHVGHMNIAEALIEVQGRPLAAQELLNEADLDGNVSLAMRVLSLDHSLSNDERFVRVRQGREIAWFLRRLLPPAVQTIPTLLRYRPLGYNRSLLTVEMLQLEWELDDEWSEGGMRGDAPSLVPSTSFTLTYPHRRHGTLPVSSRTRGFFPQSSDGVSVVTLVDGRWGTRYTGWVVHEGRYVVGLAKWMEDHQVPVGALITLERSQSGEVVVDYRTRRPKREWARIAHADAERLHLTFDMNKINVACEYDEHMIFAEHSGEELDELRAGMDAAGVDVNVLISNLTPELIKLNPQGTVHAKTVYSAVNIVRRMPPGPVFYALLINRHLRDVGGGLFAMA